MVGTTQKTQEASLEGGVSLIGSDMAMSAQSVHSYNNNKFTASGGVHLQRGDRQIFGDSVEYSTDSEYGLVSGNARLIAEGTTLTGNQVEGWMKEIRAVAQGNVTFNNPEEMYLVLQTELHTHKHLTKMMVLYSYLVLLMLFKMGMC